MQKQSQTEQLRLKINYRKHKAKLDEIRQHSASLNFYNTSHTRPQDRKKILMLKEKRQEIQLQNQKLREKIDRLNASGTQQQQRRMAVSDNKPHLGFKSSNNKRDRYQRYEDNDVIEVNSDCQGEQMKCVVPARQTTNQKYISFSLNKNQRGSIAGLFARDQQEMENGQRQDQSPRVEQNSQNATTSRHNLQSGGAPTTTNLKKLKKIIKQSHGEDGFLYHEPEKQANRLIIFKKTKIPQPMVCYLIELSLIDKRILIMAHGMGLCVKDYRMLLDRKKSRELLEWAAEDYQKIWERVRVGSDGIKLSDESAQPIIATKEVSIMNQQAKSNKIHNQKLKKLQITQDFLQRNYYTIKQSLQQSQSIADHKHPSHKNSLKESAATNSNNPKKVSSTHSQPTSFLRNKITYHREQNKGKQQQVQSTPKIFNKKQKIDDDNEDGIPIVVSREDLPPVQEKKRQKQPLREELIEDDENRFERVEESDSDYKDEQFEQENKNQSNYQSNNPKIEESGIAEEKAADPDQEDEYGQDQFVEEQSPLKNQSKVKKVEEQQYEQAYEDEEVGSPIQKNKKPEQQQQEQQQYAMQQFQENTTQQLQQQSQLQTNRSQLQQNTVQHNQSVVESVIEQEEPNQQSKKEQKKGEIEEEQYLEEDFDQ